MGRVNYIQVAFLTCSFFAWQRAFATPPFFPEPQQSEPQIEAQQILVKVPRDDFKLSYLWDYAAQFADGLGLEETLPVVVLKSHPLSNYVRIQARGNLKALIKRLEHWTVLSSPQPDYYLNDPGTRELIPDPDVDKQWFLKAIGMEQAWSHTVGAKIKIADVESGFDTTHPDLEGQFDLENSRDYDPMTSDPKKINDGKKTHGTSVMGLIGAIRGNGKFGTGIAPGAKLIGAQMAAVRAWSSSTALAIVGSVDRGADVVLVEKQVPELYSSVERIEIIYDAIVYAIRKGVPVVLPAGNFASELKAESALKDSGAIMVGASKKDQTLWERSNFGDRIDLLAPGESIYALRPNKGFTESFGGTSAAAAIVAGSVGLIRAQNPKLTPHEIRDLLIQSADIQWSDYPTLNTARAVRDASQ